MYLSQRPITKQIIHSNLNKYTNLCHKGALQAWRYKIGKAESPECRYWGKVAETEDHLVFVCEEWRELRREIWKRKPRRGGGEIGKISTAETGQSKRRTHRASLWCGSCRVYVEGQASLRGFRRLLGFLLVLSLSFYFLYFFSFPLMPYASTDY